MHRLFIACYPPEDIAADLAAIADPALDLRWMAEDQLHLTLRFIGEVDRPIAEDVAASLETLSSASFTLACKGLGTFDHKGGGSLWADVAPREPVIALAARIERLCQSVGLRPETRRFRPHITLGRWNRHRPDGLADLLAREGNLKTGTFIVNHLRLVESFLGRHGAMHREVARFPLMP